MTINGYPYGRDMSATDRIRRGRTTSGARLLAEAYYRRLITQRGSLIDDPDYGLPLVELLNTEMTPEQEAAIPGRIRNELRKDPRGDEAALRVELVPLSTGPIRSYRVDIYGAGAEGPFELSVEVTDVTATLLGIRTEAA